VAQARCTRSLPNRPESVRKVRGWIRNTLAMYGHEDVLDPALLIMSELATNAVLHGTQSDTIKLLCQLDDGILTIGVIDYDQRQPIILAVSMDDERGRGLMLVDSVSDEWGCAPCDGGKLVFARLKVVAGIKEARNSGSARQVVQDRLEDLRRRRAEGRVRDQAVSGYR
jgi:anti-sigma regulatory factor (Ser/Thr protein kinase)